ncbi:WLM domain-containing protein [Irpex lacteus]|nr:WLM domain-containing protein [Irpex lacteus]
MSYVRLNEREANPNPYINFITALPGRDGADEEAARQLLRALAAQVKPIMKAHGLAVNTLDVYQYNKVFLGRNWENGSVVEIVLRGANGCFQPISWLLGTLCHEVTHEPWSWLSNLYAQLCKEVRDLQRKGYHGDGLWSSGQRLADFALLGGPGLAKAELPEYLCGGAQSRKRPSTQRHRRPRTEGPSDHTGRQTAKKRKAGSRVTAKGTFKGNSRALNEDVEEEAAKRLVLGSGNGLEANSPEGSEEGESFIPVTDQDRRRTLFQSDADTGKLKQTALHHFANDFFLPPSQAFSSVKDKGKASERGEPSVITASSSKRSRKDTAGRAVGSKYLSDFLPLAPAAYGSLVQGEVNYRKKKSLGMELGS